MDFSLIFSQTANFFIDFCKIEVVFAGYSFTIGSLYLFGAIAIVLIWFLKEMGR